MSDFMMLIVAAAGQGAHAATAEHAEPAVAGILTATVWVSIAMLVLVGIMVWKKVPAMVAGMLDGRIAQIKAQLDEATALRRDAETLRGEYQTKLAALDGEIAATHARAEQDAAALIAQAEIDAKALVARRQRMAEDRISAAERSAIAEVRDVASRAAVAAARSLITANHDAAADRPLVERAIADVART